MHLLEPERATRGGDTGGLPPAAVWAARATCVCVWGSQCDARSFGWARRSLLGGDLPLKDVRPQRPRPR